MTRFIVKLILVFIIGFAVTNAAARALGTLQPPHPALASLVRGCEGQPCWNGIVPGETTVSGAQAIIQAGRYDTTDFSISTIPGWRVLPAPESEAYWCLEVIYHKHQIKQLILDGNCAEMRLGDVFALLGAPSGIGPYGPIFNGGAVWLYAEFNGDLSASDNCLNFSPYGRVATIVLYDYRNIFVTYSPYLWRGFLPYAFYVNRYQTNSCKRLRVP